MNKSIKSILILFMSLCLFTACQKEKGGDNEVKNVTLNVTINAGDLYTLDLSQYGDADDLTTITTQAIVYATSEIVPSGAFKSYTFKKDGSPKTGGNGNETVVVKVYEPAGRRHYDETNITINFTIL